MSSEFFCQIVKKLKKLKKLITLKCAVNVRRNNLLLLINNDKDEDVKAIIKMRICLAVIFVFAFLAGIVTAKRMSKT